MLSAVHLVRNEGAEAAFYQYVRRFDEVVVIMHAWLTFWDHLTYIYADTCSQAKMLSARYKEMEWDLRHPFYPLVSVTGSI